MEIKRVNEIWKQLTWEDKKIKNKCVMKFVLQLAINVQLEKKIKRKLQDYEKKCWIMLMGNK